MLPMSPAPPPAYQAFPDDEPSVRRDPRPPRFPRSVSDHARPLPLHHGNATGSASLPIIDNTADHPLPHAELRHTFAMGQVPSLPRALSLFLRGCVADEATRCHICFDDVAVGDTVTLSTCNHRFCARCLKPYLELKISEGNVYPVCFHPIDSGDNPRQQRACGQAITTEQIQEIVNAESFQKLKRFRLHKENDRARECPYCAHVQVYPGPEATVCTCVQCAKTFCFLHGNAHAIGSCADYELRNAKVEAINRAKIQEISKPCPGCGRHVEKNGGCNHMRCIVCETHFCWLCMKEIDGNVAALHYDESTGGPCVGRHFESTRTLFRQEPLSMRIYVVLVMITCGPIAGILGLIVTPFVWLFKRRDTFATAFVSVATFLTVVLQVPLMIPYFALVWIPESLVEAVMLLYRWVTRQRDAGEQAAAPQQNDLEVDLAIVVAR